MPGPVRVLLCDDAASFRALMRYALEEDPDIRVVGEAGDGEEGVRRAHELQPDVVVVDLSMPVLDGLGAIPRMRASAPGACIVALSGQRADRMAPAVLAAGATHYLEKGTALHHVRATVRACRGPGG